MKSNFRRRLLMMLGASSQHPTFEFEKNHVFLQKIKEQHVADNQVLSNTDWKLS